MSGIPRRWEYCDHIINMVTIIPLNIANSFDFLCETNKYLPLVSSFISDIPNSDSESFNPALWEEQRKHRAQVAFECDEDKDERETPPRVSGKLVLYLLQIVAVFYQQQLSVLVWIATRVPFSQWSGRISRKRNYIFFLCPGGKPEALSYTLPRRAEEHGEDSPVCGTQAEGGRVKWRVR